MSRFAFAANGGRFRATESLWSILNTICREGEFSGQTLLKRLGLNPGSSSYSLITGRGIDFRVLKESVADDLVVDRSTGLHLFGDSCNIAEAYAFRELCYCPNCLEEGFHSYLFQYPIFTHCPVHSQVRLRHSCDQCDSPIPYRLPRATGSAFACKCGRSFNDLQLLRIRPPNCAEHDRRFRELERWAKCWLTKEATGLGAGAALRAIAYFHRNDAREAPRRGGFLLEYLRARRNVDFHGGREWVYLDGQGELAVVQPSWIYDGVEKEICLRTGIGHGTSSVAEASARILAKWNSRGRASLTVRELAFVCWRVYWEGVDFVEDLSSRGRNHREEGIYLSFRSRFGPYFDTLWGQDIGLRDVVQRVGFRETLASSYLMFALIVHNFGPDIPARTISTYIRYTPHPVVIFRYVRELGTVSWTHHPLICQAADHFFTFRDGWDPICRADGFRGKQPHREQMRLRPDEPLWPSTRSSQVLDDPNQMELPMGEVHIEDLGVE